MGSSGLVIKVLVLRFSVEPVVDKTSEFVVLKVVQLVDVSFIILFTINSLGL